MNCHKHPEVLARYSCKSCKKQCCERCVYTSPVGILASILSVITFRIVITNPQTLCSECKGTCSILEVNPNLSSTPDSSFSFDLVDTPFEIESIKTHSSPVFPIDTGSFDLSKLRVGTAPEPKEEIAREDTSVPPTPSFVSLFKDFLLNPAVSFPHGIHHLNMSSTFRTRFMLMVGLIFSIIFLFKFISPALENSTLVVILIGLILEAFIFTGLLIGATKIFCPEQVPSPLHCALVVLGTQGMLLILRDGFFLFLLFLPQVLGKTFAIAGGLFWLFFKIWVFGKAWMKGFHCDLLSTSLILTVSFLGTALVMTCFLKFCHA